LTGNHATNSGRHFSGRHFQRLRLVGGFSGEFRFAAAEFADVALGYGLLAYYGQTRHL
jgi:hypothetical protein